MPDGKSVSASDFMDKIGSLAAGLFVLYLMVSFNFIPEIFGCHLQLWLKNSFWMKHLIGLLTVFFFINVTTTSVPWDLGIKFGFSLVLYVLFMFSNKSEYASQIGFVVIIFVMYIIQLVRDQIKKSVEGKEGEDVDKMLKHVKVLGYIQGGLFCSAMFMIAVGHMMYIGKKKMEFKGNFRYLDMLKGSVECKGTDRRIYTVREAIETSVQGVNEATRAENERLKDVAKYFDGVHGAEIDLKVPSGLSWRAPTPRQIVAAGLQSDLALSDLGQSVKEAVDLPNEPLIVPVRPGRTVFSGFNAGFDPNDDGTDA